MQRVKLLADQAEAYRTRAKEAKRRRLERIAAKKESAEKTMRDEPAKE